jgi:hypothetical protein
VLQFYREAATCPVEVIYLGETACSKRGELGTRDWIALAAGLQSSLEEQRVGILEPTGRGAP